MNKRHDPGMTAGGAIFQRLKTLGVDYVFCNSGTDFPPIIEGLAEAEATGVDLPRAIVIPHEHAAMGMAHGYWLVSGRPQAVMLHTNVGLANGAIGAINAACENVPIILMSGRTPVLEGGRFGARTVPIGWGQEMRDQAALVRESCKWDYELRYPEQVAPMLDRALAIADSTPKGPVYLSLPREVLCEPAPRDTLAAPVGAQASATVAPAEAVAAAARALAGAERPLIIAQRGLGDDATFHAFAAWAEAWALPVCTWWTNRLSIASDHPCHVGDNPGDWLAEADVVLVIDCLAPWWPDKHRLNPDATVISVGPDPIYSRFPTRTFRSNLTLAGETNLTMTALFAAMEDLPRDDKALRTRRTRVAQAAEAERVRLDAEASDVARGMTKAYLGRCLSDAIGERTSSIFSELGAPHGPTTRRDPRSFFVEPHAGGLGWSFPAALGAQLAEPDRLCVATMGDGSYMFANPVACHQIAEALELPILVVIANNEEWGAVRRSVTGLYPNGYAARANQMPLTTLKPSPDFSAVAGASRAWSRRVTEPEDLPSAIAEALRVIEEEGRLALLDVRVLSD